MKSSPIVRKSLDSRLNRLRPVSFAAVPAKGWIRAIRDALGMTAAELAGRMGVTQPTVAELETSEQHSKITLDSLQRAAAAMECQLVYALVPISSLEATVQAQARKNAIAHLDRVAHSGRLEGQEVDGALLKAQLDELSKLALERRGLWNESAESS